MKNITYIGLVICLLVAPSCKKLLDVDPDKYIIRAEGYYETETQLETALNSVYATLGSGALYANVMLGRMGLEADEAFASYSNDERTVAYYNVSAADVKILDYWQALYQGINKANGLLKNIDKPAMDEAKRNNIKG